MSTRKYTMPSTPRIGQISEDTNVELNQGYHAYLGGIEDLSGRVCEHLEPGGASLSELITAMIQAGLMKAEE
jgi:hypothetical protein